eukprot:8480337-Pyramimonas_sp.AAC.1
MLANWWTRLATVVAAIRRHRSRRTGCKQIQVLSVPMAKLLGDIPEKAGQALRPQEPGFPTLIRSLRILQDYSDNDLSDIECLSIKLSMRAQGRAIKASLNRFKEWADSPEALGALRRNIRDEPLVQQELIVQNAVLHNPSDIMDHKKKHWEATWCPHINDYDRLGRAFAE